jgi:hypothetical protein
VETYRVRVGLIVTRESHDDLDQFTDVMMAELIELDPDADIGGSVTTGEFVVWVTVRAKTPWEAVLQGIGTVRAAAHAAGGSTRHWPSAEDWPAWIHAVSVAADPVRAPEDVADGSSVYA